MSSSTWKGRSKKLQLSREQLWELMWRPETRSLWLGPGGRTWPEPERRWALRDEAGLWRTARVLTVKMPTRLTLSVEAAGSWKDDVTTALTLEIEAVGQSSSRVSIREEGLPRRHIEEVGRYWSRRLRRLKRLVLRVGKRREAVRQAVVVIHGIGEQQPGATLRNLVASGVLPAEVDRWVKPSEIVGSYEPRPVTFKASHDKRLPTTDVFEFYWAHTIRDTTPGQIATWLRRLLWRWRVPLPLRPLWLLAWAALTGVVAYGVALLTGIGGLQEWFASGTVAALSATLFWHIVGKNLAIDKLGDAARYLMPHPANVAHRQAIRQAGVDLIQRLHATGRYDRIVILGHSLGSVIAYDIVTHAWARMHGAHRSPLKPSFKELVDAERRLGEKDPGTAQAIQHAAWRRQRTNTQPWLVTDLVTVGSPLAYADYLLAESPEDFKRAKNDRVLPKCPPVAETERGSGYRRITYDQPYRRVSGGPPGTMKVFHHGAPFAVTRWTNLFFRTRWLGLSGDLIGGPIAPHFGHWIRDVKLDSPRAGVAHTWYWRQFEGADEHLEELRNALGLNARPELLALLEDLPAVSLFDEKPRGRSR